MYSICRLAGVRCGPAFTVAAWSALNDWRLMLLVLAIASNVEPLAGSDCSALEAAETATFTRTGLRRPARAS